MELLGHKEQVHRVLDAVPDEVALLDADGIIEFTNRAWQRFARQNGLRGDASSVGVNYVGVIGSGEDTRGVARAIRQVLAGEKEGFRWIYPCHAPDEQHWFEMKVGQMAGGGAVVIHTEVTDRIVADEVTRRLEFEHFQRRNLQRERQRFQELINGVSHDVATPLTPLLLNLRSLLQDANLDSSHRTIVAKTQQLAEKLARALSDFQRHLAPVSDPGRGAAGTTLAGWAQAQQREWEPVARQRSIHFAMDVIPGELAVDGTTLDFVVGSLLAEALRDMPLDGSINVRAQAKGSNRVEFRIQRTGQAWEARPRDLLDNALAPYGSTLTVHQDEITWSLPLQSP